MIPNPNCIIFGQVAEVMDAGDRGPLLMLIAFLLIQRCFLIKLFYSSLLFRHLFPWTKQYRHAKKEALVFTMCSTHYVWGQSATSSRDGPYIAESLPGSSGSWCRAVAPAGGRSPGRSPGDAACSRPRTRTSWPSRSGAGVPSAAGSGCPGTWCGCTCETGRGRWGRGWGGGGVRHCRGSPSVVCRCHYHTLTLNCAAVNFTFPIYEKKINPSILFQLLISVVGWGGVYQELNRGSLGLEGRMPGNGLTN